MNLSDSHYRLNDDLDTQLIGLGERCALSFSDRHRTVDNLSDIWPHHGQVVTSRPLGCRQPFGFCVQVEHIEGRPSISIGAFLPDKRLNIPHPITDSVFNSACSGTVWFWNMRDIRKARNTRACIPKTIQTYYGQTRPELKVTTTLGLYRDAFNGSLHFTVNGVDQGMAVLHIPAGVHGWLRISSLNRPGDIRVSLFSEISLGDKSRPKVIATRTVGNASDKKPYTLPLPCNFFKKSAVSSSAPAETQMEHDPPPQIVAGHEGLTQKNNTGFTIEQQMPCAKPHEANIPIRSGGAQEEKEVIDRPRPRRYAMTKNPRGVCLIICNANFRDPSRNRSGTKHDWSSLQSLFKDLHFTVIVKKDLEGLQIRSIVQKYAAQDHSQLDAFVCVVMSHGGDVDVIDGVDGCGVRLRDLMSEFKPTKCPSLQGKPKLFIVQACRGIAEENVADSYCPKYSPKKWFSALGHCGSLEDAGEELDQDSTLPRALCPLEADFLLAYATPPGYVALRAKNEGSFFIKVFVEAMRKYHNDWHILEILTEVNRSVVEAVEEKSDGECWEMPSTQYTLRAELYL